MKVYYDYRKTDGIKETEDKTWKNKNGSYCGQRYEKSERTLAEIKNDGG